MYTHVHLEALAALWRWFIQALQDLAERYRAAAERAWQFQRAVSQARQPLLNFN